MEPWQEPVRGGYPNPILFGLSGEEQLKGFFKGWGVRPPISHHMGHMLTDVSRGLVTFTQQASPWLQAPPGHISIGVLAALADAPLGCAVQTGLPPFTAYTTAELSINYVRPPLVDGRDLTATGSLIHGGRSLALSDVVIQDADGKLIAHGTSRCVVFDPMGPPPPEPPTPELVEQPVYDTPDPFERRPPMGWVIPQDVWDEHTGLEIHRMLMTGELEGPPLAYLIGLRITAGEEGIAEFTMPTIEHLCSPLKTIQGGTIAMLADIAMTSAVQTTCGPRTAFFPADLKINFLRPVFPDTGLLTARGTILHRGKSVAVTHCEITNAEGKRVALASGTTLVREGTAWHPGTAPDDVGVESRAPAQ